MKFKTLRNSKGFASIETTVLMVIFVIMLYYSFGFFGIVHTAILHNIHSRTYAFETFRHRSSLYYFRSNLSGAPFTPLHYYLKGGTRLHGVNTDTEDFPTNQVATERPISMGMELNEEGRRQNTHNQDVMTRIPASGRNSSVAVNPVWILTMYGICLDSNCGG